MGCVNKSSKEFKKLSARNNVDSNALELITHKYWLQTGNETFFPTDVYIQSQLGNDSYEESGASVRKLWQKEYSSPKEFASMEGMQAAYNKASRYFPKSAIVYYKNAKGNFVLSVKKPVAKVKKDKITYFNNYDNGKSTRTLNLGINEGHSYGIDTLQNLYNRFNTDRTSKDLADKVFSIAKDLGLNITFTDSLPLGVLGRYNNNNTITYKKSFFEGDMLSSQKAPIILHEVLHALSMYALSDQTEGWKKPETLEQFRTGMNSLYQNLKNNPILKGERGIIDVKEFVAELANPVFRSKIQQIDKEIAAKSKAHQSFWGRVLDAFKNFLGIHTSNTYYERSMNALDKALDAFDIDTYMRYNGIKHQLRKGLNEKNWNIKAQDGKKLKEQVDAYFDNNVSDNTINDNDSRLTNKNNKQYEQGIRMAGSTFESTFNLLKDEFRGMGKGSKEKTGNNKSLREQLHEESSKQQKALISWATKHNQLIVEPIDYYEEELGDHLEGTEATVWRSEDGKSVVKNITLNHYGNPLALLNRILIHNTAFPSTAMEVDKIGTSDDGMSIVIKQPLIVDSGIAPTMEEIEDYMINTLGFTLTKGKGTNAEYSKDGYIVADIRPENVIKQPDGTLAVIDCYAQFQEDSTLKPKTSKDFINSLTEKDLKDELSLIKQESADYGLINGVEEENKKSSKAVPQDFTFNDGTVVKAPFMPNEQQIDALNAMSDFIKSRETSMTLSGYAGTGKTSLMEMIAKKCQKQHKPVMFCATTNKAAAVLNDRVSKAGFKATTLNKTFGISVEVDQNSKSYNARNLVNNLKDVDIMPGTTIIIDEASMINEENYRILNRIADENNLKIIYVGDSAQLAPVNESQISKVFRNGDGKVITLTQVERTDDNAILKEATDIRNGKPLSGETSFNSKGEGVAYISPEHQDVIGEVISHYVEGLKKDPNHFRILAYTNKAVSDYNNQVRELLGYTSPTPQIGEPMTGYANWGYDYRTKSYRFINSESYKVTNVGKPRNKSILLDDGKQIFLEAIPITLEDSLGHRDEFEFMDVKSNPQNRQAAMILANEKKRLWALAKHVYGRQAKAQIYAQINSLDSFLFINDNLEDNDHNLLQPKTIDFGYALTIHKSQGSTFTNVLMDDVDVSKALRSQGFSEFESVDIEGNETMDASNSTLESVEDVDLGDLSDVTEEPKENTQAANIKQQLEYVGVSRATDTVTIVSNHIKKEGSPLHKKVKEDTIKESDNRSNNVNNNDVNNGTEYKQTDEFRRVQEAVRGSDKEASRGRSVFEGYLTPDQRQRLANVLKRQLGSIDSFIHGSSRNVTNENHGTSFNIHSEVNPQLFHDIFEVVRYYTKNAELVDLHDDYSDCKCYLSEDGTTGFAIEPDGNLVSVFNLGTTRGFLGAIKDMIREEGATHLDAYASSKQNLEQMYSKTLGFHTASTMDYNMEYDHDDIAKNHGNPKVVFMVDLEVAEPKHFDKNSYDDAKQYQMEQLKDKSVNNLYSEDGKAPLSIYRGYAMTEDREASNIEETIGHTAVDYVDSLKGAYYFTSDREEAMDYAKSRTDKSEEEFYRDGKLVKQRNRHYTGDFAKVSTYYISANAKVEHYEDMRDFSLNGKNSNADVIILKHGTMWHDNKEYIVRNPSVIVASNQLKKEGSIQNPTFEEAKTFTVKLPGYEYFNDLYEDSTVDAEWKIPYLKELDAQFNTGLSEEETQNIINQMDKVFQSTSKEEYLQESKTNDVDKQLSEYDKLIQQFDNLLEGGDADYHEVGAAISATEVRHTAELIVNSISDEITRLQNEEGRAKEIFPSLNTELDFKNATRREIVETVGINRLIDRAKALFDPHNNNWDDTDVILQAALIVDNWDAMMMLASDIFAFNEGFGITKDFNKGNFTTTEGSKMDYDNFNDYSNDEDIAAENGEKDEQEHWQIESKTIDVLNSMSALVRQGIHECYQIDENGQKVMSKWGIAERVNPRNAVNSILRWTQGSLSLDDMIKHLSDKQAKNPWLSQLINRLSDQSGKETDFQSQFYSVFSKHFQTYSIVLQEDGKYHSMIVNSHPALSEAMQTITAQYKIGEHPLFTASGINKKALGNEDTIGKDADFNLHKALHEMREITKSLNQGNTLDDEMLKTATNNIIGVCRKLGYNITENLLTDVINAENIKKETEYLGYIVKSLDNALKALNEGKLKEYRPFTYGAEHGIDGSVRNFLTPITDKLEDTAVSAFYDSGKMYQSYVTPSFMSKLMKKFQQSGQAFEDFIMDEYGNSEWFAFNKFGDFDRIQWRNEWLRLLAKDENARKVFDHKVELNFNKHNYMRNMNDAEYTLSLIAEYFAESTKTGDTMVPAWYRVPIQSNKPSSDFIKFYSDRSGAYKDHITHGLYNMFLQELSRIQTVRMRNLSKNDPGFIKNFDSNGLKFCFLPIFNAYLDNTPANIAKRESLHNGVEYDENRLYDLQNKENIWKREAKDYNEWEHQYVSQKLDEDVLYDKEKDPVILEERGKVKASQLTIDESAELLKLREQKKANERKLSTEEDSRFAYLLQEKLNGEEALTAEEEVELSNLANKIIYQYNNNRVQSILVSWENSGLIDAAMNIKNIYPSDLNEEESLNWTKRQVENFLWNDTFASKNILQLTLTDIAFYKDTEDLQKRLAQLHAPGNRGRKDAVDYNGKRVSDGKYRTFILSDFDSFKSNIIANISEVFDRKIAAAPANQKAQMQALKESLVGENGKYTRINVTDAQGYSSPSSYRKKAFIFGRWSHQAEDIYQRLIKGEYNFTDLETAFQPLKPFVYSKLTKDLGISNAPIHTMQVPFQAKNAEYLLIMADAILKNEQLSRPNLLRAVYRVMEDSEKLNPTMGIDTVQFESAIKSGLQGKMNIYQFRDMEGGEEAAYTYMMNQIYKSNDNGELTKEYNTDTFVHETSYDDYCLQQEVPEHFKEHSQAHGSQIRMITPSDLDLFTTDENGNQVDNYYEWTEPNGEHKKLKADEFRKEYEQTIAANIEQSIDDLAAELHFNSQDKKERNLALSKILQREILSSPRYGVDLIQACAIDKETGDFRIPKGDPIQAKRIEQLINSIIKNRVNKQKIAGGPIVQVSNFGTSHQLHIRFNDKQGNLMPLEEEYNPSEHDNLSYKDFIKKHQGGIAYFEVFAPIWSNELFNKFSNADGTINMEAIEATDPELLKMVSYRIPTEDKYSCAPMKVVGFMPREAGDAIMLPYELTEIDDSDFDVDKRYVMRKDIPIKTKRRSDIEKILFDKASEAYKKMSDGHTANIAIGNEIKMFLDNPQRMKNTSKFQAWLYRQYQKAAYYTEAPTSGRIYRDNKIIDMTYAVLTNQMTADKILNPGGFDAPKKMGYMVAAYKNPANNVTWEDLQKKSIDELKDLSYTDKDLTFADTQVQFYKQNSAAASLIGVFAVNKVAHATLESNDIYLDVSEVCGENPFTIINTTFGGRMQIDSKYDQAGTLIGKTLGSLVSASADAVKDPILNLMNINMTTAGILNTMLRLGMTFDDAALFLSQDIIERTLSQFNRENLSDYVPLNNLIDKWLDAYKQKYNLNDSSAINTEPLTKEELVEGLTSNEHEAIDYKVLLAFKKLKSLTDVMRKPTYATRFNSISSAVGPLIIDNLIIEHKMNAFLTSNDEDISTHFYTADDVPVDIEDIFFDHPVLKQFSRTVDIAKSMFLDMPTGSNQFRSLLEKLPTDISEKMYNDKKLLDQFSNFYQSYLLIQSGLVNPAHLKDYAIGFAKWFMEQNFKEKYPTNALIQAIRMNVSKKSKRPYLMINITGMDEQQKEELKNAWVDLHKEDPELSKMLFDYSFFRAGIGFSPKTFMSLVPTYVKMRLKSKDESASYVDTYRNFPDINKDIVIDQFIRNNWDNNKLVPWRGGKDTKYNIDLKNGRLTVYRPEDKKALQGISYMKTSTNKETYLWHYVGDTATNDMLFERIKPLGNNGEYLEMDINKIVNPLSETIKETASQSKEDMANNTDNDTSYLKESTSQEIDAEAPTTPVVSETETVKDMSAIADLIQKQVPKLSHEEAEAKANEIKNGNIRQYRKFLQNVFKQKGLTLNEEEAINEFKKYC